MARQPSPSPRRKANDDVMQRHIARLGEASLEAVAEHAALKERVETLERERDATTRSNAHAFEGLAGHLTDLGVTISELPSASSLHEALVRIASLEERGEKHHAQNEIYERRMEMVRDHVQGLERGLVAADEELRALCQRLEETEAAIASCARQSDAKLDKELRCAIAEFPPASSLHAGLDRLRQAEEAAKRQHAELQGTAELLNTCLSTAQEGAQAATRVRALEETARKRHAQVEELSVRLDRCSANIEEHMQTTSHHASIERVRCLEELGRKRDAQTAELAGRLDASLADIDRHAVRLDATDAAVAGATARLAEEKADKGEQESLAHDLRNKCEELERALSSKAGKADHERLSEALNQSCRDAAASLTDCRQDLAVVGRTCADMESSMSQVLEEMEKVTQNSADLERAFEDRRNEIAELERQWSRRLWGYGDAAPAPMGPRRRPASARAGSSAPSESAPAWKPWPATAVAPPPGPAPASQRPTPNKAQTDGALHRLWESGPQQLGAKPLRTQLHDNENDRRLDRQS